MQILAPSLFNGTKLPSSAKIIGLNPMCFILLVV